MAIQLDAGAQPSSPPSGTVTFLFSDIEGSTERWERDREAMAEAVRRHDSLMNAAIVRNGGFVFKTVGDAFCAAFGRTNDAFLAAIGAQRDLAAADFAAVDGIRVRMALHTGEAFERDRDYFGPAVNRVARLLSLGHGGQVLVSAATAMIGGTMLPEAATLMDLGTHRLKDLREPEHVYQCCAPGLVSAFPPLNSLDLVPNNLPAQLSHFIGRSSELAELKALLEQHRLITLAGPGGVGKTRCALQAAAELSQSVPDGAWIADLTAVAGDDAIVSSIAESLRLERLSQRTVEALAAHLKSQELLLVLDNCEHVIDGVRHVAAALLHACPKIRIVATSRERLNIAGEVTYDIPPLSVPPEECNGVEEAAAFGSVQLFEEQARAADKRFHLQEDNLASVVEICRKVDGLPLAIELAAARANVLSVRQIASKLDERLRVLTSGNRNVVPHHRTMRALIDWSYNLLSEPEQVFFRRLSVFAGTFSFDAAEALCAAGAEADDCLERLSSLVDKSLVQADVVGHVARYRLLESLREYASQKLDDAERASVAHAHATIFAELAEQLAERCDETPDAEWSHDARWELENFRAALRWSIDQRGDVALGRRLCAAMRPIWSRLAPVEGVQSIRKALAASEDLSLNETAGLQLALAHVALLLGDYHAAEAAAHASLEAFEQQRDQEGASRAQLFLGAARGLCGETTDGEARLNAALQAFRARGRARETAAALQYLALMLVGAGEVDRARLLFSEALALFKSTRGAERSASHMALALAELEFRAGDTAQALSLAAEALKLDRARRDDSLVAFDLCNIAAYHLAENNVSEALPAAREALQVARRAGVDLTTTVALQHIAASYILYGSPAECTCGLRIMGFVDARIAQTAIGRDYTEQQEYDRAIVAATGTLAKTEVDVLLATGANLSEHEACELALDQARSVSRV